MQQSRLTRMHVFKTALFIIIAVALITIVLLSRSTASTIVAPGEETYKHLNAVEQIHDGTATSYLFYDVVLSWLLSFMSLTTAQIIIPGILLLTTMILFSELMRREKVLPEHITYALALIVLSPAFIMMYVGFTAYAFTITLVMAIAYLYTRRSYWYAALVALLFLADRITALIVITLLVIFEANRKRNKEAIGVVMITLALILLSAFAPALTLHSLAPFFSIQGNDLFSFFGGTYGYSFVLLFLGILGMVLPKSSFSVTKRQSITVLVLILSLFYDPLRLLSMFILAYYGAVAFDNFMTREWTVTFLKQLTILLILCILMFSTSTTLKDTIVESPLPHEVEATKLIGTIVEKNPSLEKTSILTHPLYSDHVEFYSGLDTLDETKTAYDVLSSQQYAYVKEQLQENEVSFIIIDKSKKDGNLWQRPEQGIQFVLQNNRLFKNVYAKGNYAVYYYTEWDGKPVEHSKQPLLQ